MTETASNRRYMPYYYVSGHAWREKAYRGETTMAFDQNIADQLRAALGPVENITAIKMFGGICYLKKGHMLCGVSDKRYMFRVGKQGEAEALAHDGCEIVTFKNRMSGIVWVQEASCPPEKLPYWIGLAERFVDSLPPKKPKKQKPKKSIPRV